MTPAALPPAGAGHRRTGQAPPRRPESGHGDRQPWASQGAASPSLTGDSARAARTHGRARPGWPCPGGRYGDGRDRRGRGRRHPGGGVLYLVNPFRRLDLNATRTGGRRALGRPRGPGPRRAAGGGRLDATDALWDVLAALAGGRRGTPRPGRPDECRDALDGIVADLRSAADEPRLGELLLVPGGCGSTMPMSTSSRRWTRNTCPYAAEPWTPTRAGFRRWGGSSGSTSSRWGIVTPDAGSLPPRPRTHDCAHPCRRHGAAGPGRPQRRGRGRGLAAASRSCRRTSRRSRRGSRTASPGQRRSSGGRNGCRAGTQADEPLPLTRIPALPAYGSGRPGPGRPARRGRPLPPGRPGDAGCGRCRRDACRHGRRRARTAG